MLTHGWPSTIVLFSEVIGPLSDPTAHGGAASDAFDVVVPSLPGFGFSEKPVERGWNAERTARAWGLLMQRLGYARYVAQGRDWGCVRYHRNGATARAWPGRNPLKLRADYSGRHPGEHVPDQKRAVAVLNDFREKGSAYFQLQATRPQTIGYALADSAVGQAAWIYDIFNSGTGNTGNPDAVISRDRMLDEITLFWLTNTAASSARFLPRASRADGEAQQSWACRFARRRECISTRSTARAKLGFTRLPQALLLARTRPRRSLPPV